MSIKKKILLEKPENFGNLPESVSRLFKLLILLTLCFPGRSRTLLYTKQLMDEELQQYSEELLQEVEGLLDHDYSPTIQPPLYKRPRMDTDSPPKCILSSDHIGGTLCGRQEVTMKSNRKYIEPPLDDVWPPPNPGGQKNVKKVVDKLEALTNELKINISDSEGMRTVLLKVPQEQ